jgi:tetratricopeptide (TPR) repeat protein
MQFAPVIRSVTTPLGVVTLTLLIVYGIYKLIFENRILSSLDSKDTAKVVGRIVNWLGVLALIALCLVLAQPYLLGRSTPDGNKLNQIQNAMTASFNQGLYDAADIRAQEALKIDPNNPGALNMRGIVAFYSGNYQPAVQYFTDSLKADPNDSLVIQNLANAYIEVGGYQRAIDLYNSAKDVRPSWSFGMGRACLYGEKFDDALSNLEPVASDYYHGAARVLEAAALVGSANNERNRMKRPALLSKASANLREGIAQDSKFWEGIFNGTTRDIHGSHTKETVLLGQLFKKIHG